MHTTVGVVQGGCAQMLCTQGCARRVVHAYLCRQRMVVHGGYAQGCAQWCAQVVRTADAKSCAHRAAQGLTLFRKALFVRHKAASLVRLLFD